MVFNRFVSFWDIYLIVFLALFTAEVSSEPIFPTRNVDTRTIRKVNGRFAVGTNYLPIMKMSLDGRVGMQLHSKGVFKFFAVKPEKVIGHFKDSRNKKVGGNMIDTPKFYNGIHSVLKEKFGTTIADFDDYEAGFEGFLCEKSEQRQYPYVCATGQHDCYHLTLINPLVSKDKRPNGQSIPHKTRFASVDLVVMVANPKTPNAYISNVFPIKSTAQIGPNFDTQFSAEHNIVGDQRLLLFRTGGKSAKKLNSEGIGGERNNIVYSSYKAYENGKKTPQCDVTRFTDLYPITHAYFDSKNNMRNRYKFARYPFRDSMGQIIGSYKDLGGSYPWMDEDAANLFFTATGQDRFYNYSGSQVVSIYPEAPSGPGYITPNSVENSILNPIGFLEDRIGAFEKYERTAAVSFAGFWTHGKTVTLDGLLNNTDYNFEISTPGIADMTRKFKLYRNTPQGQYYEPTGLTRDQGVHAEYSLYENFMPTNANYMNSMTNRFNYLPKMKPGVPRDITWHFSSTRFGEELVFDDFISPYMLINAEMNAAIGTDSDPQQVSMINYDGFYRGNKVFCNLKSHPEKPCEHTLVFQNASTAPDDFMKVPRYGRPYGPVRVEPIAKGGIYGKGLWLEKNSGVEFKIPYQTTNSNRFNIEANNSWYVSLFVDARWNEAPGTSYSRTIVYHGSSKRIELSKKNKTANEIAFDHIRLLDGNKILSELALPGVLRLFRETAGHRGWRHIGIQFRGGADPILMVDGMAIANFTPVSGVSDYAVRNFFDIKPGQIIGIGARDGGNGGFRGWVDDFKVIARDVASTEERCNYARGTLVKLYGSASNFWKYKASHYPQYVHNYIANQAGQVTGNKYVCNVEYGNYDMSVLTPHESYASLHEPPAGTQSVRQQILLEGKSLKFGQPRPGFAQNKFCLSCHVPNNQNSHKEMNLSALFYNGSLKLENDPRRQPLEPPAIVRGIIPANYFGPGKPASTLNNQLGHKVDQWISR